MQDIFYKREGRRYVPVSVYDSKVMDGMPIGTHLVIVTANGSSRRYHVDPAFAPFIAAGYYAEDAMSAAVREASSLRPRSSPLTPKQQAAWKNLERAFDNDKYVLEIPSSHEIAQSGIKVIEKEAAKLMDNPAVKEAYEHFMLICKLAYSEKV